MPVRLRSWPKLAERRARPASATAFVPRALHADTLFSSRFIEALGSLNLLEIRIMRTLKGIKGSGAYTEGDKGVRSIYWVTQATETGWCAGAAEPIGCVLRWPKRGLDVETETGSGLICVDLLRRATVHRSGRRRFGRPGGRNVDSNPRRFAVACCQTVSPKGMPTWALRLTRCHKLEVLVFLNRTRLEPPDWASRKRRAAACRPAPEPPPGPLRTRRSRQPFQRSYSARPRG
jgi:hypothetical protein